MHLKTDSYNLLRLKKELAAYVTQVSFVAKRLTYTLVL